MPLRLKKLLELLIVVIVLLSLILQFSVMLKNPAKQDFLKILVQFFSYFTILSNCLVLVYFLNLILKNESVGKFWKKAETGTAITVYISVVGIVYHAILSQLHNPVGLAFWADHGLHSFSPILVMLYWVLFTSKRTVEYATIPYWLIYPAVYFLYTILRGSLSGFYPYPFLDLNKISFLQALGNSLMVLLIFTFLSLLLSKIANKRFQILNMHFK
ncbi:Pr6Pr family membrane protein [Sediminibacterium sp.]|uniref:Pr6Pr family membrane protein n=1 Tax=Sediminibacterium sp. TaxID=1917865 RepID=UPI003F69EA73